jgi:hypothetical protein
MKDDDRTDANPAEEDLREIIRAVCDSQVETYRVAFRNTANPIYVWKVLQYFSPQFLKATGGAYPPDGQVGVLPEWCLNYLLQCGKAVDNLSHGVDPRKDCPEITSIEQLNLLPRLAATQAVELLPALFGFVRPGWSAVADFEANYNMRWPEKYLYELRSQGIPYARALAETAAQFGYEDERSLRRRLAKRRAVFDDYGTDLSRGLTRAVPVPPFAPYICCRWTVDASAPPSTRRCQYEQSEFHRKPASAPQAGIHLRRSVADRARRRR